MCLNSSDGEGENGSRKIGIPYIMKDRHDSSYLHMCDSITHFYY